MAQPFAAKDTISSVGYSTGILIDPDMRVTNVLVTGPSTTSDITLQMTLDYFSNISTATRVWANVSSVHMSYSAGLEGTTYTFVSPVAGLRLASSVFGSTWTVTMKVLQATIA